MEGRRLGIYHCEWCGAGRSSAPRAAHCGPLCRVITAMRG
jgi:hypothetical protein